MWFARLYYNTTTLDGPYRELIIYSVNGRRRAYWCNEFPWIGHNFKPREQRAVVPIHVFSSSASTEEEVLRFKTVFLSREIIQSQCYIIKQSL